MPVLNRRPLLRNHLEQFRAACAAGLSVPELMERFGLHRDTVCRWKVRIGLPPAPRGHQAGKPAANRRTTTATCIDCGAPVCWLSPGREKLRLIRRCKSCAGSDVILPTKEPKPTGVPPGTPQKVAVLEARYAAGEYLFHPEDAVHE